MQPISNINLSECPSCKTFFTPLKNARTCSEKCRNALKYADNKVNHNSQCYLAQQIRAQARKKRLIEHKGGKCEICGYNKNASALCFHHTDPSQKEVKLDSRSLSNRSWEIIVKEVEKCQLLCSNCHMEIHHPQAAMP